MTSNQKSFTTTLVSDDNGRVLVPVPFNPDTAWGRKLTHRVAGSVNGHSVRGELEDRGSGVALFLGPAWRRDCGFEQGDEVEVMLFPEGPQRDSLAPDIAAALAAEPEAGEFSDSLAQFYRKAFLKWIDATKRRPDLRRVRIDEMVDLLKAGRKERPTPP
jgi:Bacteriocin-protection, YdeI or OmpD-Associated/Domain of unknown function (DUF1905)